MQPLKPFTLQTPSVEDVAKSLGHVYERVSLSREPLFAWVQIINDVTILGEDLRRDRRDEAVQRAGKVMMRLLEFLGYYLYVRRVPKPLKTFADHVARSLRKKSYRAYFANGLPEGPTRWILVKYPNTCSKCGRHPCHCSVTPWVLENRREEPEEYFKKFTARAEAKRKQLSGTKLKQFTLQTLLEHFQKIYRNQYWNQEPWKIGMHLSEEVGEATIELSRMELQWRAERRNFDVASELPRIFEIARDKIQRQADKIADEETKQKRIAELNLSLSKLESELTTDTWRIYETLVSEKFKEEVADVFSWLAAIIVKLDERLVEFKRFPARFTQHAAGDVAFLGCPWCHEASCTNACLIKHGISSEITEKVSKF